MLLYRTGAIPLGPSHPLDYGVLCQEPPVTRTRRGAGGPSAAECLDTHQRRDENSKSCLHLVRRQILRINTALQHIAWIPVSAPWFLCHGGYVS